METSPLERVIRILRDVAFLLICGWVAFQSIALKRGHIRKDKPAAIIEPSVDTAPSNGGTEGYSDVIKYISEDLKNISATVREQQQKFERLEKDVASNQEKTADVMIRMVERLEAIDTALKKRGIKIESSSSKEGTK